MVAKIFQYQPSAFERLPFTRRTIAIVFSHANCEIRFVLYSDLCTPLKTGRKRSSLLLYESSTQNRYSKSFKFRQNYTIAYYFLCFEFRAQFIWQNIFTMPAASESNLKEIILETYLNHSSLFTRYFFLEKCQCV